MNYAEALSKLQKYNQEHLLKFYEKLDLEKQQELLDQIESLNLEQIEELYESIKNPKKNKETKVEPIEYIDKEKLTDEEKEKYIKIGNEILSSGKVAAVTMAGGQGTRLGHNGPKGTFDLGLDSHKSLFEIICDTFKEVQVETNCTIPWYVMTSEENNEETEQFFEKNNFFDYPKEKVTFFKQGKYPMIDVNGKILLDTNGLIKEAADGHGGVYIAMLKNGILEDMKNKGIKWIIVGGVDNVLVKMFDPLFIGLYIEQGFPAASKSVVKKYPEEKVGVFCKKDGRPSIIEYTELSDEMAHEVDENGELKYGESNIIVHIFELETMEKISKNILPYHPAFKKANYMDENGNAVISQEPNAYKFEAFIFDAFEQLENMTIFRVKREEEFAPVKNADEKGVDCPKTARELYIKYHNSYEV